MAKKEKKLPDWDDGRTVAPMNGDELPSYRRRAYSGRKNKEEYEKDRDKPSVTKKERRAMTRAYLSVLLPRFAVIILSFALVAALMFLWLS
ncbi:MAG: hypothetical protein ACLSUT_05690 [Christensenellales bacterium]|jgi:hypothetical protein